MAAPYPTSLTINGTAYTVTIITAEVTWAPAPILVLGPARRSDVEIAVDLLAADLRHRREQKRARMRDGWTRSAPARPSLPALSRPAWPTSVRMFRAVARDRRAARMPSIGAAE